VGLQFEHGPAEIVEQLHPLCRSFRGTPDTCQVVLAKCDSFLLTWLLEANI
jgi:hypothetical protein